MSAPNGRWRLNVRRCHPPLAPDAAAAVLVVLALGSFHRTASAAYHQVCLDFDFGPEIFDASPRQPSGDTCPMLNPGDPCPPPVMGLTPWEVCDTNGECVPMASQTDWGEDYGRWEGVRPFSAERHLFRVSDNATGEVLWGWAPLGEGGCTEVFPGPEGPDDPTTVEDYAVEWTRWTVSPEGHSILGYECELHDDGATTQGPDGVCEPLEQALQLLALDSGSSSVTDCSSDPDLDHCTLFTAGIDPAPGQLDPVDVNLWIVANADKRVNFLASPSTAYLLQETDAANAATSSTGPWMGRHHCIRFKENQWHEKYTPAHEYGHLVAFNIPNEQGGHPTLYDEFDGSGDLDDDGDGHTFESAEWHSVASVEGLADFVALAAWNDLSVTGSVDYLDWKGAGEAGLGGQYLDPNNGPRPHPHGGTGAAPCDTIGAGQACEYNWANALRMMMRLPGLPLAQLEDVIFMVSAFHGSGNWVANGADTDFVDGFDTEMQSYLLAAEYAKWSDLVPDWEIDQ